MVGDGLDALTLMIAVPGRLSDEGVEVSIYNEPLHADERYCTVCVCVCVFSFTLTSRRRRYAGYHNSIYPLVTIWGEPLHADEICASSQGL
jgi:hypothetical protein